MPRFDDIEIFVMAAENGSLSAAARALDIAPAVASIALKRLESDLGTSLMERTTRSLRLTRDGEFYLTFARRALSELQAGCDAIDRSRQADGGRLSMAMPSDLGRNLLTRWLDDFHAQHPDVMLQVRISDRPAQGAEPATDLAIRYGQPEDSALVALPLAPGNRRVLCASPEYFARRGKPLTPNDLETHNCLRLTCGNEGQGQWDFVQAGLTQSVRVDGDRVGDDGELLRRWAVSGKGLLYVSRIDVLDDIRAGRLESALDDFLGEPAPLYLLCGQQATLSPTFNGLRMYLQRRIDAYLDVTM